MRGAERRNVRRCRLQCSVPCMPVVSKAGNRITWNHFSFWGAFASTPPPPTPTNTRGAVPQPAGLIRAAPPNRSVCEAVTMTTCFTPLCSASRPSEQSGICRRGDSVAGAGNWRQYRHISLIDAVILKTLPVAHPEQLLVRSHGAAALEGRGSARIRLSRSEPGIPRPGIYGRNIASHGADRRPGAGMERHRGSGSARLLSWRRWRCLSCWSSERD